MAENNTETQINQLEEEMDRRCGTRIRDNLQSRKPTSNLPNKFKDNSLAHHAKSLTQLHTEIQKMSSPNLSLTDYSKLYAKIHCTGIKDEHNFMTSDVVTTCLTQYHVSKGLKVYGQKGIEAVLKELNQLHDRMVIETQHPEEISKDEKKASLQYLMFLKKKRSGIIKGIGCADGRKQRVYLNKDYVSAPTVETESLLLTCLIDAMENRDIATVDIPGAFMQSYLEGNDLHMKLEGKMVDILAKLNPAHYTKYARVINGKKMMYVKLKKALYSTLQAALLFWKSLMNFLIDWGFVVNPYDWCVANKMVNGKQLTIVWHVDDLKISHVEADVVTTVISKLEKQYGKDSYGKECPLTVCRGKKHDYLGMTLDYTMAGKVAADMIKYIESKILNDLPDNFNGIAVTPAANHLFEVNDNCTKLDTVKAELFHHITAQLLFLAKRGRPDLLTGVAFLTTWVQGPDEDDYKKLQRVIKYLRDTADLILTLESDKSGTIHWFVDAAFAFHHDMKGHTGGMLSLGKGAIYSTSQKQKLNTKSSTESELVGVDDLMPQILWTRLFLQAQGFCVTNNIVYQDNQSSIKLENNGRGSSGKHSRHINICYFFVTDRVAQGDLSIKYCPTDMLIADFYTKPL